MTLGIAHIMKIRAYEAPDEQAVVALWQECGLTRPWNDPRRDIARKLTEQPELFLVGTYEGAIVATAMVGFDGHRGWVTTWQLRQNTEGSPSDARLCKRRSAC